MEVMMLKERNGGDRRLEGELVNGFSKRRGEIDDHRGGFSSNVGSTGGASLSSIELERQREKDRKEEIDREVSKALKKKSDLLSQPGSINTNSASIQVHHRDGQRQNSRLTSSSHNRPSTNIERQRAIDRAQRSGPTTRDKNSRHREHESDRKPPILIYEKVTEYVDNNNKEKVHGRPTWPSNNRRPGTDRHPSKHHHHHHHHHLSTVQDTRAPDRPVSFRPAHYTDRRPDRPGYDQHYVEIHPQYGGSAPVGPVGHIETVQQGVVPSLDIADAAKAQALIQQQILAGQAIQANNLKRLALAARLKAIQARKLQQHQAAIRLQAIKAGQAQKAATQLQAIKAGKVKQAAAQSQGQAQTAMGSVVKTAVNAKLQANLVPEVMSSVIATSGGGYAGATSSRLVSSNMAKLTNRLLQAREKLFKRLIILRPYFTAGGTGGYYLPKRIPNIPVGVSLSTLQVEALPTIAVQQVPTSVSTTNIHLPELKNVLTPPLDTEYIEYLLNLPDNTFKLVLQMTKREFLVTLFPTLYRDSVRNIKVGENIKAPSIKSPISGYGVPIAPPIKNPSSEYGVPLYPPLTSPQPLKIIATTPSVPFAIKSPSPSYGPPKSPSPAYGPPEPTYNTPKPPIKVFSTPKAPSEVYGPPKPIFTTPRPTTVGPPVIFTTPKPPVPVYGPPKTPSPVYGPPKGPSIVQVATTPVPLPLPTLPPVIAVTPAPPSQVYGAPKVPHHHDCHHGDQDHHGHHHGHHHHHDGHHIVHLGGDNDGHHVVHLGDHNVPVTIPSVPHTHIVSTTPSNPFIPITTTISSSYTDYDAKHNEHSNFKKYHVTPAGGLVPDLDTLHHKGTPHHHVHQTSISPSLPHNLLHDIGILKPDHDLHSHVTFPVEAHHHLETSNAVINPVEIKIHESDYLPGPIHLHISEPVDGIGPVKVTTSQPQYDDRPFHTVSFTTPKPDVIHVTNKIPVKGSHHIPTLRPNFAPIRPHNHPTTIKPGIISTTPVTTSTVVVGVGLRPHGSDQEFFSPVTSTISPPLTSIAPLFPTTTVIPRLPSSTTIRGIPSSTYADDIPSTTFAPSVTTTFSPTFPPITPTFSSTLGPLGTTPAPVFTTQRIPLPTTPVSVFTTTQRPFTPTRRPTITTIFSTTPGPTIIPETNSYAPPARPVVTSFPSTLGSFPTTTPSIFGLGTTPGNIFDEFGQQPTSISLFDDGLFDSDEDATFIVQDGALFSSSDLQKLTAIRSGLEFDRIPGTDHNDDIHILTPFSKRKGNSTSNNNSNKIPAFTQTDLRQPLGNTALNKNPPVPKLVGGDGLPVGGSQIPSGVPGFPGGNFGPGPQRPITAEDLAKLPAYLREAPGCATVPTNRSFCLMPQDYPSQVASSIVEGYKTEIEEIASVLVTLPEPSIDLSQAQDQLPSIDSSVNCESEDRTVELSWAQDVLGNWFVILQTPPFSQPITVTTCSATARLKGCRPLLQPRPLIAFQPNDVQPRPFVFEFPVPVACVFSRPLHV